MKLITSIDHSMVVGLIGQDFLRPLRGRDPNQIRVMGVGSFREFDDSREQERGGDAARTRSRDDYATMDPRSPRLLRVSSLWWPHRQVPPREDTRPSDKS